MTIQIAEGLTLNIDDSKLKSFEHIHFGDIGERIFITMIDDFDISLPICECPMLKIY